MKTTLKKALKHVLEKFDVAVVRQSHFQKLTESNARNSGAASSVDFLLQLPPQHTFQLLDNLRKSKSQLRQDLFVLSELNFKRNGYFVEFGATNGFDLSNTHLLEKEFGWKGILAEPAKCWQKDLHKNRNCHIETDCVWTDTGSVLTFNEVSSAELSTIHQYSSRDMHKEARQTGKHYDVKTISFNDLLEKYKAPKEMDYLSIDTEGSELEILKTLDFDRYQFKIITCEHNFTKDREEIHALLTQHGYRRKMENVSKFDDWYVLG